ncbi:stationary phase survival protein SurE [Pseudopedobacter beijingensis]|uniref:Stationary phase survival protein SurE n=1 Tax=Pseudopedobacter beijingensis TaxID=1207056 RepID=A0ABW4I8N2_9SPHI
MFKKDSLVLGVLYGLALPSLAFLVVDFIMSHVEVLKKADLLYIGCVALNFFSFNKASKKYQEQTARGIILATFICSAIFAYYKLNQH